MTPRLLARRQAPPLPPILGHHHVMAQLKIAAAVIRQSRLDGHDTMADRWAATADRLLDQLLEMRGR